MKVKKEIPTGSTIARVESGRPIPASAARLCAELTKKS